MSSSLPFETLLQVFYTLHNRGDRASSGTLLRLNRDFNKALRARYYHTLVITQTNSSTLTRYLFGSPTAPPTRILNAVRRIVITSLPDFDAVHLGPHIRGKSHPIVNLSHIVLGSGIVLDAALCDQMPLSVDCASEDPLSSLLLWLCGGSCSGKLTSPPRKRVTICHDFRDLQFPLPAERCVRSLPPGLECHDKAKPRLTMSEVEEGVSNLLHSAFFDERGGINADVVYHGAQSIPANPYIMPLEMRLEMAEGTGSLTAVSTNSKDASAACQEKAMELLEADTMVLSGESNRLPLITLEGFWSDAPRGWYDRAMQTAGWNLAEMKQGQGERWTKKDRDIVISENAGRAAIVCGCGYDSFGGAVPILPGRMGTSGRS